MPDCHRLCFGLGKEVILQVCSHLEGTEILEVVLSEKRQGWNPGSGST